MRIHRTRPLSAAAVLALGVAAQFAGAAQPTAIAIEYFNTGLGRYLLTADPAEAALLDSGAAGAGWQRTGGRFGVFASGADAPSLAPACRFEARAQPGLGSRFYTANAAECAAMRADPAWSYQGVAFYVSLPDTQSACAPGTTPVYRAADATTLNTRYTVDATVYANAPALGYDADGVVMCVPLSAADVHADAVRLLRQATFGATPSEAQRAAAMGAAAWVDAQLAMPETAYPDYPWVPANRDPSCVDDTTPPVTPTSYCARDNYSLFPLQVRFFANALTRADQLRARVAFALSEIMVTSGVANPRNYAMREYQQLLEDHAFGNYYDLLLAVTLSPQMGAYLNMANNNKANAATGTQPNENYGREILQLFSIGLSKLNPDGTVQTDANGTPIPTYDQNVIEGFSHVFTGWTYAPVAGAPMRNDNPLNFLGAMLPVNANHDFTSKLLLDGAIAPAGLAMAQDLAFAHQAIFNHPNVGPFIGRQLIQKLVTSQPSPGYVARVSAAFADDGTGKRGNLAAVVRAILLDPEARGARKIDPGYGKLLEPALFVTSAARAGGAQSDGVFLRAQSAALSQNVFYAPTVFNFYLPGYVIPGTQRIGPEYQLFTAATAIGRANFANTLLYGRIAPDPAVFGATGTTIDLSPYTALAGDANALADRLADDLLNGTMSDAMHAAVVSAIGAVAPSDAPGRVRAGLYLVLASPQFQVQR